MPTPPPASPIPVPSLTLDLLPDPPEVPAFARPLAIASNHAYAAIWPHVRRRRQTPPIDRELILIRDDGHILLDSPDANRASAASDPQRAASIGDCLLPTADRLLPQDRFWSAAGLQRYLDGRRPDPADVFRRLVAVLNHFVDFSGSLAEPALAAILASSAANPSPPNPHP